MTSVVETLAVIELADKPYKFVAEPRHDSGIRQEGYGTFTPQRRFYEKRNPLSQIFASILIRIHF